jgi:hypothetical protein
MQLNQAINCLKALNQFERRLSFEHNDDKQTGYIIRIEGLTYIPDRELVKQIAKSLNLTVKEDPDRISIF